MEQVTEQQNDVIFTETAALEITLRQVMIGLGIGAVVLFPSL